MNTKNTNTIGRVVTITSLALVLVTASACSGMSGISGMNSSEHGAIQITADREGMRAFGDAMNGLITTGKASPDMEDAHHKLRSQQAQEITTRKAYDALPSTNPFAKFLSKGGK